MRDLKREVRRREMRRREERRREGRRRDVWGWKGCRKQGRGGGEKG